jgi:hypothetical protein
MRGIRLAGFLLFVSSGAAPAQELTLADPKDFYEAFVDSAAPSALQGDIRGGAARVVGATIVGLRFGGPAGSFDPKNIHVQIGSDAGVAGKVLCMRALSRDGRYFARAQYQIPSAGVAAPLLDFRTNFLSRLQAYGAGDLAILVSGRQSCNDAKELQNFAIAHGVPPGATQLIVQIRAGDSRVRAQLGQNNAAITPAIICEKLQNGPTVAYTSECALPLPASVKSGTYQLSIGETGANGELSVKTSTLVLSPPGDAP